MSFVAPLYWYKAKVSRIIDGDTIVLDIDHGDGIWQHDRHVRLYGIDAPERNTDEGKLATQYLQDHLPDEIIVRTFKDKRGSFGRLLVDIFTLEGDNINTKMINEGFAREWHPH